MATKKTTTRGQRVRMNLFADYSQLHLLDEASTNSLADAWTAQATDDQIAEAGDIVGIGAADTAKVKVEVVIGDSEPPLDPDPWDHVTEASISIPSGKLVVMGCTDPFTDAKRIKVAPGTYRVRSQHTGRAKGPERIEIALWPAAKRKAPRVLKRFEPPLTRS